LIPAFEFDQTKKKISPFFAILRERFIYPSVCGGAGGLTKLELNQDEILSWSTSVITASLSLKV
jgi:hypothetical protein